MEQNTTQQVLPKKPASMPVPVALLIILICLAIAGAVWGAFAQRPDMLTTPLAPVASSEAVNDEAQISSYATTSVRVGSTELVVDIANTRELRTLGLSGRAELPIDRGMLFVFPENDTHTFWMKDMYFPIDIFWIDDTGTIISLVEGVLPDSYPEIFAPSAPVRLVLETRAGFAKTWNIKIGDRVSTQKK